MGYIGYIPSFWMSETWSFAGPDIHLQFAGAESSAEAWHFDWSSPDRLSSRMFHGWQWMDRKVHWDKPEASWSNVTSTECAGDSGDSCRICRPCLMSKHSCTVKKWTVRAMRVMIGKDNTELPVQEGGLCVSFGRCNFWVLTSQSFSTCLSIQILSWEQWNPEAQDAHPKPGHSNIGAAVLLQVFAPQAFQMLNLDELVPVK